MGLEVELVVELMVDRSLDLRSKPAQIRIRCEPVCSCSCHHLSLRRARAPRTVGFAVMVGLWVVYGGLWWICGGLRWWDCGFCCDGGFVGCLWWFVVDFRWFAVVGLWVLL
uniref:Transmembrane protein n=1 Tax=Fagus sylvatica TaxID=28930 RepID=A0A2N9I377_FAGSY